MQEHTSIRNTATNRTKARGRLIWGLVYLAALIFIVLSIVNEKDTIRIGFRALIAVLFLVRVIGHFRAWNQLRHNPDQD